MDILLVGAGGFIGAISRYSFYLWQQATGNTSTAATLFINALGCLLAGIMVALSEKNFFSQQSLILFISMGFIASFTTFSTLIVEIFSYLKDQNYFQAFLIAFFQLSTGLIALILSRLLVLKILR